MRPISFGSIESRIRMLVLVWEGIFVWAPTWPGSSFE